MLTLWRSQTVVAVFSFRHADILTVYGATADHAGCLAEVDGPTSPCLASGVVNAMGNETSPRLGIVSLLGDLIDSL